MSKPRRTAEERAREIRREARIKERKRCARIARVYRQQDPYISEEAEQASREIERQINPQPGGR